MACGQRGKVASLPGDLVCLACMTGEHLDVDEGQRVAVNTLADPTDPMAVLPPIPEMDLDMAELSDKPRKAVVPEGSAPYSQQALGSYQAHRWVDSDGFTSCIACGIPEDEAIPVNGPMVSCPGASGYGRTEPEDRGYESYEGHTGDQAYASLHAASAKTADIAGFRSLLAQYNGLNVTLTYDDDLGLHQVSGPLTYHPPTVVVGSSSTTEGHVLAISPSGGQYSDASAPGAYSHDRQYADAAKHAQIVTAVLASNPGMDPRTAARVADKTLTRYPRIAG